MSTMEHLFMQIFEWKKWITGQLRKQIESHVQSLAYNLLANGSRPPPWLLTMESAEPGCPDIKVEHIYKKLDSGSIGILPTQEIYSSIGSHCILEFVQCKCKHLCSLLSSKISSRLGVRILRMQLL